MKNIRAKQSMTRKLPNRLVKWLAICLLALLPAQLFAHSVGQVQTTKFFAPETVQMLINRAASGTPGLRIGDTVSYLIQFTPVSNGGAVTGAAGYITDYIPAGTQVIDAAIVQPNDSGGYSSVSPDLPGSTDNGFVTRNTYLAGPFTTVAYDTTGLCQAGVTAGNFATNQCNGSIAQQYADTGIFFSSDPRTAVFVAPNTDGRVRQGCTTNTTPGNGYNINPTASGQLNPIIGQTCATTHNLWDANQTNAFGSTQAAITALATPKSAQVQISSNGRNAAPFGAGSAVAGPQTGYPLDDTGAIGPWQRIAYVGSRIGTTSTGPAIAAAATLNEPIANALAVKGAPTGNGWNLTSSNPLPSGTNAVRWAVGQLVVGQLRYVKINLKLTALPSVNGIINNSEVFGGDAAGADNSNDSTWRYHIPSVADNNSNLLVLKKVVCVYSGATCIPSDGATVPVSAKVRYNITYLNSGNATQNNVVLTDTLPAQATAAGNLQVISGVSILPSVPALSTTSALTTIAGGSAVTFQSISGLAGGAGGAIELDVQTNAVAGTQLSNKAKLTSSQVSAGVTSFAVSNVVNTAFLTISKTTSTPNVVSGGTATYTLTITNTGAAAATNINVYDFLPTLGGVANPATRFSYASTGAVTGLTTVAPTAVVPPTQNPYSANTNQQQVLWNFGAQSLAVGASATITFNATVGGSVPASSTPYTNDARVVYNSGSDDVTASAPVTVTSPLTVSKTIDCIYVGAACNPYNGNGLIPTNAKLRYRIIYQNTGATAQTNVVISDTLPAQTLAGSVSNPIIISGASILPTNPALASIAAGGTFNFQPIASLAAGAGGELTYEVQTNAANGASVTNTGNIKSNETPGGMSSAANATAINLPILNISKTTSTPDVQAGGVVTYTIAVSNTGTAAATGIKVYDFLPFTGTTDNVATRFNYVSTTTTTVLTGVTPTVQIGPAISPYSANPNQQQVLWDFTTQSLAAGATATITFTSSVGNAVPAPAAYTNSAQVLWTGGAADAANTASVNIISPLTLTKSIDCVYSGASCIAYSGGVIPPNAKVRYRLTYQNVDTIAHTNVVLSDTLPAQTAAASVSNAVIVSGASLLPTTPAFAAITAGGTFSFTAIPSLAAGAGGAVTFDVQTNAASGAVVVNTSKIISTQLLGGATSSVSATALAVPILQMTKTVSPASVTPGGTATYTLTVTNTSAIAASSIKVYDFLPTMGGAADATKRFSYVATPSISGLATVVPSTSIPPTQSPYSVNANQQEVLWDFGVQSLAAGASFSIVVTANAGNGMTVGSYINNAQVISNNPSVVTASASVLTPIGYNLGGRVFEDVNYGGGAGRACVATAGSPTCSATTGAVGRSGARVELYDSIGNFVIFTTTDVNGDYTFGGLAAANYAVRVVNNTVTSGRTGYVAGLLPVQTFRTSGLTGSVGTADVHRVGGENPQLIDANANTINATLATLTSASATSESITAITMGSSNVTGIDFGYNFDTVVNTNDSGQGSLRQFILNSNALANTGLAQVGQTAGKEVSVFMIADGIAHPGLRAGLPNLLTGGVAVISPTTLLPAITDANTTIDGTTQTSNVGNTNSLTLGAGGVVGVDGLALPQVNAPEVQIQEGAPGLIVGLDVQANNTTIRGTSIIGFGSASVDGNIRVGLNATTNFTGTLIEQNLLGTGANNFTTGATIGTTGSNIAVVGADNGIIRNNLIGFTDRFGVLIHSAANGWVISGNEVRSNDLNNPASDGISIESASQGATVSGNLVINNKGVGVDSFNGAGLNTIVNNTISGNGFGGGPTAETAGVRLYGTNSVIDRNIITSNAGSGVMITAGATNNVITKNSIYANGQIGIDLLTSTDVVTTGSTPYVSGNDGAVIATSGNKGMDYPIFTLATFAGGTLTVSGYVGSAAGQVAFANATIEIFKADNAPANQNGEVIAGDAKSVAHGEGRTYLGTITADANGNFTNAIITGVSGLVPGDAITATATLAANGSSEFSANQIVIIPGQPVSGTVYSDPNHNSNLDSGESGTGQTIYAKLIQAGVVQQVVAVNPATGAYQFAIVPSGSYTTIIDDNNTVADATPTLPAGWLTTETPSLTRAITVVTSPIANQNFGLFNGSKLTGTVFSDTGTGGGTANDGIQNGTEPGVPAVTVKATNASCAGGLCDSVTTDTNGNYTLWIPAAVGTAAVTVTETNPNNTFSTGGVAGTTGGAYSRTSDATTFNNVVGTTYSGVNFADVPINVFLSDGAQSSVPGAALYYPHIFTAGSGGSLLFTSTNITSPLVSGSNVPGWNTLIFIDSNCNGVLDGSEGATPQTAALTVVAGQQVCIIVKENIPSNAPLNGQDQITVTATFTYTNANPAIAAQVLTHTDITTIGSGAGSGLTLQKNVCVISSVTNLCTTAATANNAAKPGDLLEYSIVYTNTTAGTLTAMVVKDTTPAFTLFDSATCGAPIACTIGPVPALNGTGAIQWNLSAPVAAGAVGNVSFRVRIQ